MAAPAAVALFHRADRTRLFLVALATMLAVMILPLCRLPSAAPGRSGTPLTTRPPAASGAGRHCCSARCSFFMSERRRRSRAGPRHARRFRSIPAALSIAAPSLFWAALPRGARRRAVHSAASRGAAAARRRTHAGRGHMRLADRRFSREPGLRGDRGWRRVVHDLSAHRRSILRAIRATPRGRQPGVRPRGPRRRRGAAARRVHFVTPAA